MKQRKRVKEPTDPLAYLKEPYSFTDDMEGRGKYAKHRRKGETQ